MTCSPNATGETNAASSSRKGAARGDWCGASLMIAQVLCRMSALNDGAPRMSTGCDYVLL